MPPQPAPDNLIIGQVVAPFGIKGEVKVTILTEFPDRFNKLEAVIIAPPHYVTGTGTGTDPKPKPVAPIHPTASFRAPKTLSWINIESVRAHKGQALIRFEGVDSADSAELLRNYWVMVPLEQAHKLPRGAYYLYQLIGLEVYTTEGTHLGKLEEVLTTSANDVYVVRGPGVTDPTNELLVPAVKKVVKSIDVDGGRVVIVPPSEWT
jgi:16S rRNA processing protein RimM